MSKARSTKPNAQICKYRFRSLGFGFRALVIGLWSAGFGLRTLVFRLRSSDFGLWPLFISKPEDQINMDLVLWSLGFGLGTPCFVVLIEYRSGHRTYLSTICDTITKSFSRKFRAWRPLMHLFMSMWIGQCKTSKNSIVGTRRVDLPSLCIAKIKFG